MFARKFQLNEQNLSLIGEIGKHMPGGFFIYRAAPPEELLYANEAVFEIFGCADQAEFAALTGNTFRGMVHPEDYDAAVQSICGQIAESKDQMDYAEYRIIRRDGAIRWVDDYGHYTETDAYGGIYYVFISDITEKRERLESDAAVRQAVIEALSETYHTVWLIRDVETESLSLYRGDTEGLTDHAAPIRDGLGYMRYSQASEHYINTMVAEEDRDRLREALTLENITHRLREKPQFSIDYLRMMQDGSQRYFRIELARVNMPGGKLGVVCGFKDVDDDIRREQAVQQALLEGQKAEEEMRRLSLQIQSAEKLAELMDSVSSLLSNMPAMSFSKDAETGKYLACNQAFADYAHKARPEDVVGLTDHDIFDPETAAHFVEDDRRALAMDSPYIYFEDVPDAEGKAIRNLQTTRLKFLDAEGKLCILGMCVDVTEMTRIKAAEARQQELERRLALQEQLLKQEQHRIQLDNMITAMASDYRSVYHVDLDIDEAVCYRADPEDPDRYAEGARFPFHERFADYCEKYVDEAYQSEFMDFIHPDSIRRALATENIIACRYLARRKDTEYYEMLRMAGVRHPADRDDHVVHAVGVGFTVIDAEMRKSLDQRRALADALKAAEQANNAKTAFLSNMSHEIRTPMNAIIGLDSLALRNENLAPETREYLEKIDGSARHLLGLINDILDMSRIESGRMVIRREEFSFRAMLEQINTMVMSQCSERGLKYECVMQGGVSDYYIGDDMKLKQVLINILSNAIKFTDAPGSVTLSVERTGSFNGQSTLKFVISDTGIGMDREFIPKIFDSFTQEDSSRSSKYGSTGLGMAITKNIVELMNGTVSVESEKGVGSAFTVIVTLQNCDHRMRDTRTIRPKDIRVLVVDDEEIAGEHARLVLEEVGIHADTCSSGAEALQMLEVQHTKNNAYNLVLLDWRMPEMDGLEVARRIRKRYDNETTVIILTSFNWDEIMDEAFHAGVDSFLAKPLFASNVVDEFERIARKNNMSLFEEKKRAELKGRRVLLAEDVFINAEIMKQLITMKEAEIEHAENGRIALEMFARSAPDHYDAILMDVRMPEMDGLEATQAIRALNRPDAKRIPIIAMTANAFDEDVQRSLQVGMNAHLSKPVEPDHLFQTMEELIWAADEAKRQL